MICGPLFDAAGMKDIDCPILLRPKCHPRAHIDVHVSKRLRVIFLSCGKCDRLIQAIKIPPSVKKK